MSSRIWRYRPITTNLLAALLKVKTELCPSADLQQIIRHPKKKKQPKFETVAHIAHWENGLVPTPTPPNTGWLHAARGKRAASRRGFSLGNVSDTYMAAQTWVTA